MESITIRVEDSLAKEISRAMKPFYSTKTEFVREAIRDKLIIMRKQEAIDELRTYIGRGKTRTSEAEERRIREEVGKDFAKKFGIKLDYNGKPK